LIRIFCTELPVLLDNGGEFFLVLGDNIRAGFLKGQDEQAVIINLKRPRTVVSYPTSCFPWQFPGSNPVAYRILAAEVEPKSIHDWRGFTEP
jgi:hypothetical protein